MTPSRPTRSRPSADSEAVHWSVVLLLGAMAGVAFFVFFWMLPMGVLSEIFHRELASATSTGDIWSEFTFQADLDLVVYTLIFDAIVIASVAAVIYRITRPGDSKD